MTIRVVSRSNGDLVRIGHRILSIQVRIVCQFSFTALVVVVNLVLSLVLSLAVQKGFLLFEKFVSLLAASGLP
jgi:hypothetical protein